MNGHSKSRGHSSKVAVVVAKLNGPGPAVDAEFHQHTFNPIFEEHGLNIGRCLGSKSACHRAHPKALFVPNANVFSMLHGKLWWGDLDVTASDGALERVAHRLRSRLFVLTEFDGRFDSASLSAEEILLRAIWCTGGTRRIPRIAELLRQAGLRSTELARILFIKPALLRQPQRPDVFLRMYREVCYARDYFAEVAQSYGHKKWGEWWTSPHPLLAGRCPLHVLRDSPAKVYELIRQETRRVVARLEREARRGQPTATEGDSRG